MSGCSPGTLPCFRLDAAAWERFASGLGATTPTGRCRSSPDPSAGSAYTTRRRPPSGSRAKWTDPSIGSNNWFLQCLQRAIASADGLLGAVLAKARFWERFAGEPFNPRQIKVLNRVHDGLDGKLNSSRWARLAKCSQDTAGRDINDLIARGVLRKDPGGGRSTSYSLVLPEGSAAE